MTPLLPTFNRIAGLAGWRRTPADLSVKNWTVHPGCVRTEPACLFDESDLARVTGYGINSSAAVEQQRVRGGRVEHGACTAHLLRDVVLSGGHLMRAGMTVALSDRAVPLIARGRLTERKHAVLAATHYGFKYFGHWVGDDLPLRLLARELGTPVTWDQPVTAHQRDYALRLGLGITALGATRFRELVVLDDRGQNDSKRQRLQRLRESLRSGDRATHDGVMLLRGDTGEKRVLVNEPAVAEALRRRGFRIAKPGEQSAAELIDQARGARVVVGVEGSQNAHGLLSVADGGTLIALQPPNRFNNVYKDRCDCVGLRYGFQVGHAAPDGGFTIDVDALCRLLDRVQAPAPIWH